MRAGDVVALSKSYRPTFEYFSYALHESTFTDNVELDYSVKVTPTQFVRLLSLPCFNSKIGELVKQILKGVSVYINRLTVEVTCPIFPDMPLYLKVHSFQGDEDRRIESLAFIVEYGITRDTNLALINFYDGV